MIVGTFPGLPGEALVGFLVSDGKGKGKWVTLLLLG